MLQCFVFKESAYGQEQVRSQMSPFWSLLQVTGTWGLRLVAECLMYQLSHLHTMGDNRIYNIALSWRLMELLNTNPGVTSVLPQPQEEAGLPRRRAALRLPSHLRAHASLGVMPGAYSTVVDLSNHYPIRLVGWSFWSLKIVLKSMAMELERWLHVY